MRHRYGRIPFLGILLIVAALAAFGGPHGSARAADGVVNRTAYTDEAAFLDALAALGYPLVTEGFEEDSAWGGVRTTIGGGQHTAPSIGNHGITWTANNPNSEVTTGNGPARNGQWGLFTLPHGDPLNGINDGFVAAGPLFAAGGWFETNTPFAGIHFIIDGDEANPVDFDGANVLTTQHQFFGVVDGAGFAAVEFRETEGEPPGDLKYMFADDFSFGLDPSACVANPDINGDGTVDVLDVQQIAGLWTQPAACPVDQNGDGLIDIVDVMLIAAGVGGEPAAPQGTAT